MQKSIKFKLLIILFIYGWPSIAQEKIDFGKLTAIESEFSSYKKDTTASAVYLYEYGDNYFEVRDNYIWLITKYHAKIKILNKKGFHHAEVSIPYYNTKDRKDKIVKIKALTHNEGVKNGVKKEDFYQSKISDNWSETKFTFSNVKVGSILEYEYEMQSPFYFNLTGWKFQSDIPKIYSEFNAKIPGNWVYNRSLIGSLSLNENEATVKKHCFRIPSSSNDADCEALKYVMKDIPAFEESEEYMLSANNYRSRLEFELSEYKSFYGGTEKYTKSWEDVDHEFKYDNDIGSQLRKNNFFEKNVEPKLLTEGDDLTRARNVYEFVKNHFAWNEDYGLWSDNKVKNAFDEKKGSVAEINIALINLLNAADLKANMMLMATRKRGLPKKSHPVMNDFNYIVAKVDIEGESFLLDATDKTMPFGMLPYRCLNYYGRVMDFDNESYWYDVVPENQNKRMIRVQMSIDSIDDKLVGMFDFVNSGYLSVSQKEMLHTMNDDEYAERLEEEALLDFKVKSHEIIEKYSNEKLVTERVEFEIENLIQENTIYLNPFLFKFFDKNPFTASERNYPIDFGYPRSYRYLLNLKIPEGYSLKSQPENLSMVLPGNVGNLKFSSELNSNGILNLLFDFELKNAYYNSELYSGIKELFAEVVKAQNQSLITLEKTK